MAKAVRSLPVYMQKSGRQKRESRDRSAWAQTIILFQGDGIFRPPFPQGFTALILDKNARRQQLKRKLQGLNRVPKKIKGYEALFGMVVKMSPE